MKFKNILLYAALLSGMSFSSCTDFLDEDSNPNAYHLVFSGKVKGIL